MQNNQDIDQQIVKNQIPSRSLFVVGDDAQSIYSFRGSKIEIILNFEHQYPGTKEIILNQNYRSTQAILNLAEKILTHNPHQKKKELYTTNNDDLHVYYYLAKSERDEAGYIMREIFNQYGQKDAQKEQKPTKPEPTEITLEIDEIYKQADKPAINTSNNDGVSNMFDVYLEKEDFAPSFNNFPNKPSWGQRANQAYGQLAGAQNFDVNSWQIPERDWSKIPELNDCVVLYRTHSQSRSLEETFLKHHLPYRLVSGVKFLDRKEIKDVLAILKFVSNPEDTISLNRFLPLILEGVGSKTMEKIVAFMQDANYPLAPKNQEQVFNLLNKIENCLQSSQSLIQLSKELINATGYTQYLKLEYPLISEYQDRMNNIGELYSIMLQFENIEKNNLNQKELLKESLNQFLAHISLMTSTDEQATDNQPKISLMSLHQSKGLEFETVFLVGIEDGLLPHINSLMEPDGFEEEVRLAYVGVTRAKKYLHLISAESRVQFGQIKSNPTSRIFRPFLDRYTFQKRT